jgi:hypothetical protein
MLRTIDDLRAIREEALFLHRDWKRRSWTSDLIARNEWSTLWDDLTTEASEALVENIYTEALEDKAASAATLIPQVIVAPSPGTRSDRAEMTAQRKRRAFLSYAYRSNLAQLMVRWYLDWYQHGAAYGLPWCDFNATPRYPYYMRLDPRQAYPMAHDSKGNLTAVLFSRVRRWEDLRQEYGTEHPTINRIEGARASRHVPPPVQVEEIWYFDTEHWAVAAYDDDIPEFAGQFRYVTPIRQQRLRTGPQADWLIPPEDHRLDGCPAVEARRETPDGEYRGALDVMMPNLRVAHNLMARILEDTEQHIYAPVVMQNIENPEDYGPGAILLGTGDGDAKVTFARPPVNFEGLQHIQQSLDAARNVGRYPQQRRGDFGASIASAKGVTAVMGAYNTELAWAQRDVAYLIQRINGRCANFDEKWCPGSKQLDGFDEGEVFTDRYDPATLFRGDYRNMVTFGGSLGLDQQQHILMLASMKNMEGMARRTFMAKSGLVDNALREERDMALEQISDAFFAFALQQANQGNVDPLQKIAARIDDDSTTVRAAVMDTIAEVYAVPAGGQAGPQGGSPMDLVRMARSLSAGGVPGSAEGMPAIPSGLERMLPPNLARIGTEMMPGGTAA